MPRLGEGRSAGRGLRLEDGAGRPVRATSRDVRCALEGPTSTVGIVGPPVLWVSLDESWEEVSIGGDEVSLTFGQDELETAVQEFLVLARDATR